MLQYINKYINLGIARINCKIKWKIEFPYPIDTLSSLYRYVEFISISRLVQFNMFPTQLLMARLLIMC